LIYGLDSSTLKKIISVVSGFPEIEQAILYGSRAMGTEREGSDIDLCIKGRASAELNLGQLLSELEDLNLPYFFDISDYHQLNNTDLLAHIDGFGKVVYQSNVQAHQM